MSKKLVVSGELGERLSRFLAGKGSAVELVEDDGAGVCIDVGEGRAECDRSRLLTGGWIRCADAREMACDLGMETSLMGEMLDFLDIKVRNCGLGCF